MIHEELAARSSKRAHPRRGGILARSLRRDLGDYLVYFPRRIDPAAPLLVSVHGISLNAREHVTLFGPLAEERGVVVVAPIFDPRRYRSFQRLKARTRADLFLNRVVDDVRRLTGGGSGRFAMFGFSGGGQFAHRYALVYPQRVRALIVAAPGWYTFPDQALMYPHGLAPNPRYPHVWCKLEEFLRIRTRVVVGEADIDRDDSLNTDPDVDRQGRNRLERASRWAAALRRAAAEHGMLPSVSLVTLPGVTHSFSESIAQGGLARIIFEALY